MSIGTQFVGVLGGMGPAATVDFLSRLIELTPATCDQDHLPTIVWSDPSLPDRSQAIVDPCSPSPVEAMCVGAKKLEELGANFIAIPCNTAHHWHQQIQNSVSIPILHIADCVVSALRMQREIGDGPIGLMGTDGTLTSAFFSRKLAGAGFNVVQPDPPIQSSCVMGAIRAVKAGKMADAEQMARAAARHLIEKEAKVLVLACTELPIALKRHPEFSSCLDATLVLAEACIKRAFSTDAASGN